MFVTEHDHHVALTLVGDAASATSRAEFLAVVLPGLQRVVAFDETSYGELVTTTWRWTNIAGYPTTPQDVPEAARVILDRPIEHPWISWVQHGYERAVRLSRLCGEVSLERHPYYTDFYRPRGLRHAEYLQIARSTGRAIGICAGRRECDFSDREHDILEHIRVPLGQAWSVARRTERLRAAAHREPIRVPAELDILTDAERHVSALVLQGLDNAAIAEVLGVSVKAIEQHLTHTYRRLGIHSRTQLVVRLARPT